MGRYYALQRRPGRDASPTPSKTTTSRALPATACRAADVGVVVALADKLETLVGMFGIGNLPTGDRDPFALRRHALGVIRMLVEKDSAAGSDTPAGQRRARIWRQDRPMPTPQLADFIYDRLAGSLREQGYSAQESRRRARPCAHSAWATWWNAWQPCAPLPTLPEAPALAAANKRVGNILKKADGRGGSPCRQRSCCARAPRKRAA